MGVKKRTDAEIKAYIDGYNESFNRFRECLNIRPLWKAIREMEKWVRAVNSIVEVDTNDSNT